MRPDERLALRTRFQFRCGYCGIRDRDAGAELTVDHFQPSSKGGAHDPENWVYCCHACNEFKGDYWHPDSPRRILHPLRDDIPSHLVEDDDGRLRALTEAGAFHIDRLHLNRGPLIEYRRERRRQDAARQVQAQQLEHLKELQKQVRLLTSELNEKRSRAGDG